MAIRIEQVHLWKSGKPRSLNQQALGIPSWEVLTKTFSIQQVKRFFKIYNPQRKVVVVVVYCAFAAIGSRGVIDKMQLR